MSDGDSFSLPSPSYDAIDQKKLPLAERAATVHKILIRCLFAINPPEDLSLEEVFFFS